MSVNRTGDLGLPAAAVVIGLATALPAIPAAAQTTQAGSVSPPIAPARPAAPQWQPDNRLTFGADAATLTGTNGGAGGNLSYLQQFSPDLSAGAAVEYQQLANSYWSFGSLNMSYGHALTTRSRWDIHADVHEGHGDTDATAYVPKTPFTYAIEGAGAGLALPAGVALDVEDRDFDVDGTTGYLPKLTLAKSLGTHWLMTGAYASSYSGNLNTDYGMLRLDFYGRGYGLLAGGDVGRVSPAVLNIAGALRAQARHLSEVFAGLNKRIGRIELSLLGDNIDLAGIRHLTVTLDLTLHFR